MVFETPQGLQDAFKTPKETISNQRSLFKDSLNFLQNFMIKLCRLNIFIYFVFLSVFCNTCIHWVQIHLCVRRCECVNPLSGVTAVRMCDIIAPSRIKVSARRRHTDTDWSWDETGQTPVIVKKRKKKKNQKLLRLVLRLIINYCDWRKTVGLIGRPAESFIWLWFLLEYFWETVCQ